MKRLSRLIQIVALVVSIRPPNDGGKAWVKLITHA